MQYKLTGNTLFVNHNGREYTFRNDHELFSDICSLLEKRGSKKKIKKIIEESIIEKIKEKLEK